MKKIIPFFIFVIFFFCACATSKKEISIEGIIEESEKGIIGIHYPKTGISSLDKKIESYIFKTKEDFENEYIKFLTLKETAELNIDYEYFEIQNRYCNVSFITFKNAPTIVHEIYEVKTFIYDKKTDQFMTLDEIANLNLDTIKLELIKKYKTCILMDHLENSLSKNSIQKIKFLFTTKSVILYFNPGEIAESSCGIMRYEIPVTNFKIDIEPEDSVKKTFNYHPSTKELSTSKPTIALTFDDGPSKYTKQIIELLNQYDANATFFILGNKVKNYEETLKFLLENGNEIGNHSYNHKKLSRLSKDELQNQIEQTNKVVKETLNYDIKFLRPTYGAISENLRKNTNMEIVLWNVDTTDWKLKNSKTIASKTLHDIKDEKIILMHDIYKSTLEALKIILPELKKQGYQIVTVSELKEIQKIKNETKSK